jgi:hypothetical protein
MTGLEVAEGREQNASQKCWQQEREAAENVASNLE